MLQIVFIVRLYSAINHTTFFIIVSTNFNYFNVKIEVENVYYCELI